LEVYAVIAGDYNINIQQGATFERVLTVTDNEGNPLDLTGYAARMQIRPEKDSATIYAELTTENNLITIDGLSGKISLTINAITTSQMTREGVYDLEIISSGGKIYRLLQGIVRIDHEVTR
jgi:hypothetical protein